MKKYFGKQIKQISVILAALFAVFFLPQMSVTADAADVKVMTITAAGTKETAEIPVYARDTGYGYYDFYLDSEGIDLMVAKLDEKINISVTAEKKNIIREDSLSYDVQVTPDTGWYPQRRMISFSYVMKGKTLTDSVGYYITPHMLNRKVVNCHVSESSKGFRPSKSNYLPIETMFKLESYNMSGDNVLQLRILNSGGQYVFKKTYAVSGTGFLRYKWNGKASKGNEAGVKAGSYVKSGTYRAEVSLLYRENEGTPSYQPLVKTKSFKVSKKASKGTKGLAKANEIPHLTGYKNIDYIAEKMVKSAGVLPTMTEDQKVKRIYHYMTTHFKHVHYSSKEKYKIYYSVKKHKKEISAYRKKSTSAASRGELVYNYAYPGIQWNMQRRIGVCNDHAAIFALLCNHVGVDAGTCSGYYKNRDGSLAGHTWNYAVVNGKKWYYDIDVEIQNYGKGQGDYYWYKKTKSQANKTHLFR